jgi:hypothetical protein
MAEIIASFMYGQLTAHQEIHHQPINILTAGAQAFPMDYPQGELNWKYLTVICEQT